MKNIITIISLIAFIQLSFADLGHVHIETADECSLCSFSPTPVISNPIIEDVQESLDYIELAEQILTISKVYKTNSYSHILSRSPPPAI